MPYQMTVRGLVSAMAVCASVATARAGVFASAVDSYEIGGAAGSIYNDPNVAVGSPERFTGEGSFPGPVTMFNPAFGADEIVTIGEGGQLTLRFATPVLDDPSNLYGVDLIVFGNVGFADVDFPNGVISDPPFLFGEGLASIEVSADGVNFVPVSGFADALFPTQGYLDVSPFDVAAGSQPTDFCRPINPALTGDDFAGLSYAEALALYDGSGGGTPIDISGSGLASISYIRFAVADDGLSGTSLAAEIDAVSVVPEPASLLLSICGVAMLSRRRRKSA